MAIAALLVALFFFLLAAIFLYGTFSLISLKKGSTSVHESEAFIESHHVSVEPNEGELVYGDYDAKSSANVSWKLRGLPRKDKVLLKGVTISSKVGGMKRPKDGSVFSEAKAAFEKKYPIGSKIRIYWVESNDNKISVYADDPKNPPTFLILALLVGGLCLAGAGLSVLQLIHR